jgi:ribosomal subunit interface protein
VDVVVKGRHCEVTERFRRHAADKLGKLEKFDHKVLRVDVELCKERNPRQNGVSERVELTVRSRGPVVRAEAAAQDFYAALDLACTKLEARLRRVADRRRVRHGQRNPVSVSSATGGATAASAAAGAGSETLAERDGYERILAEDGPCVVRKKVHYAVPMDLDEALFEMELVGHDFFLFIDAATGEPAVVYRRRGYDYGVIRLRTG